MKLIGVYEKFDLNYIINNKNLNYIFFLKKILQIYYMLNIINYLHYNKSKF